MAWHFIKTMQKGYNRTLPLHINLNFIPEEMLFQPCCIIKDEI